MDDTFFDGMPLWDLEKTWWVKRKNHKMIHAS